MQKKKKKPIAAQKHILKFPELHNSVLDRLNIQSVLVCLKLPLLSGIEHSSIKKQAKCACAN